MYGYIYSHNQALKTFLNEASFNIHAGQHKRIISQYMTLLDSCNISWDGLACILVFNILGGSPGK